MKLWKWIVASMAVCSLVACGGAVDSASDGGAGGGTDADPTLTVELLRGAQAVSQITSTETVRARATVRDGEGNPVEGVVVKFAEADGSLLTFAPNSATALTDANGVATVDVSASDASETGATTVQGTASVDTVSTAGAKSIQITAGSVDPTIPPTPAAINFIGSVPADTAIVIKGTGGNGRSESAILTFKVVDAANTPIGESTVNFALNANNGGASIVQQSAVSNSGGLVNVTVTSGTQPASIVVTATVASDTSVTSQSDTLIVSNSVGIAEGFEINATVYNIDGRVSGTETTLTARVRDEFGNPVPDGVAVNFTTDFGVVAQSALGGCTTENGVCSVTFRVQDPRGDDVATVVGQARVGESQVLSDSVRVNMAGASGTPYLALDTPSGPVTTAIDMGGVCKQTFEKFLSDGNGKSTAADTTISAPFASPGATVSMRIGTPVLDVLDQDFPPTAFGFQVDLSGTDVTPACVPGGGTVETAFIQLQYNSPGGISNAQRIAVTYPAAP